MRADLTPGMFRYLLESEELTQEQKDEVQKLCEAHDAEFDVEAPKIIETFMADKANYVVSLRDTILRCEEVYGFERIPPIYSYHLLDYCQSQAGRSKSGEEAAQKLCAAVERMFALSRQLADHIAPEVEAMGHSLQAYDYMLFLIHIGADLSAKGYADEGAETVQENGRKLLKLSERLSEVFDGTKAIIGLYGPIWLAHAKKVYEDPTEISMLRSIASFRQELFFQRSKPFRETDKAIQMFSFLFPDLSPEQVEVKLQTMNGEWELKRALAGADPKSVQMAMMMQQAIAAAGPLQPGGPDFDDNASIKE